MRFKRLLALLLAAALALAVLVGCGSGQQSAAQALLKLLDGKYPNISIEIDPELEADLRQAISQAEAENAGDDAAAIRAALEKLVGSTVTFRYLGEGQQGDTTFDLVFYAGTDPDKAAQAAYSQWNIVFDNVPDDGQYDTSLAMVETENGIWMLVKATVEKAGTVDKPDTDDDEPEEPEDPGYTESGSGYTVTSSKGLQNLFDKASETDNFANKTITLKSGETYTVTEQLTDTFSGTLTGDGQAKIELSGGASLFGTIADGAEVSYLDITVSGTISGSGNVGAVAGENNGTIQNCDVTGGTIQTDTAGKWIGGIVGNNNKQISNCTVTGCTINGTALNGGIAGKNSSGSSIDGCTVKDSKIIGDSTKSGNLGGTSQAGGIVGQNLGTVGITEECKVEGSTCVSVTADGLVFAGGIVGQNLGTVKGSWNSTGDILATSNDIVSSAHAGGIAGNNGTDIRNVTGTWNPDGKIEAKRQNGSGDHDIATVTTLNPGTAVAPDGADGSTITASAGTLIGYNGPTQKPVSMNNSNP